jgi:hypothetical protein
MVSCRFLTGPVARPAKPQRLLGTTVDASFVKKDKLPTRERDTELNACRAIHISLQSLATQLAKNVNTSTMAWEVSV